MGREYDVGYDKGPIIAKRVWPDTLRFSKNLSGLDDDLQKALETIDQMNLGLTVETDPLSLHLDQTAPQTMTGLSDGYLKLTSSVIGSGPIDLSGYVPYTGATGAVDLGVHNFLTTGTLGAGAITGTTLNALTLTSLATGYTIAGGTTSKTLTLDDNFVVSTQLAAIGANTSKATNATHTGDVTGATALALDPTCISGKTGTTIVAADYMLFWDATDSLLKKVAVAEYVLTTAIDTYSELNAIVADVTLTHNGLIDTFAKLDAIVADKALINKADGAVWLGVHDFGGATSFEIPNAANPTLATAGMIAINTTDKTLEFNNGANQVAFPTIRIAQGTFDMSGAYDAGPAGKEIWLVDLHADSYPHGIYITKIYVDCDKADPTTELAANLNYCDAVAGGAFPGANPTLIKAIGTTTGNFADAAVNTAIPTGKSIYITITADPADANTVYHVRIHYYMPTA